MRIFSHFAVAFAAAVSAFAFVPASFADNELDIRTKSITSGSRTNAGLDEFANSADLSGKFYKAGNTGNKGAYNTIMNVAWNLKNLFIAIAVVMLVVSVLRLLFSKGGDDDVKKWKSSIVWSTIGIIVMQSAYVFVSTLYDVNVDGFAAKNFYDAIVQPFTAMLEMLASFAFLAMVFVAFFKLVSAGGDEEKAKAAKRSIFVGIVGFMIIKIPKALVQSIYGTVNCEHRLGIIGTCKLEDPNVGEAVSIMTSVLNYVNGFLAIVTILLIIWAGWLVVSSGGDDEKLKQAKNIVKYIFIGIFLLVSSYILFNFFLGKDT